MSKHPFKKDCKIVQYIKFVFKEYIYKYIHIPIFFLVLSINLTLFTKGYKNKHKLKTN